MALACGTGKCGVVVLGCNLTAVFICELAMVEADRWHMIRGSVILLLMKLSSIGFDIDAGVVEPPDLLCFSGYSLAPSTMVFGPFVTLSQYQQRKNTVFGFSVLVRVCNSIVLSYMTVLLSTCVLSDLPNALSNKLVKAYFTAQSFRASHYFVCYLSQSSALIAGYGTDIRVAEPAQVEIPKSMSRVAISWNRPMHFWLKTYIYKKSRGLGQFVAALFTYTASSILHGINFQLPAVLLSIFIFSYVEARLREELAVYLDCCMGERKSREICHHSNNAFRRAINGLFVLINVIQLAYLGVLFDSSPIQVEGYSWLNVLRYWTDLYWCGHLLALIGFLLTYVLKRANAARAQPQAKHRSD